MKMQRRVTLPMILLIVIVSLVGGSPLVLAGDRGHQPFWLITPEEAAMAPAANEPQLHEKGLSNIGRGAPAIGPIIEVIEPEGQKAYPSPVPILVRFKERLASIDLATLKVTLLKFFSIDITDRVKPYASLTGIDISNAPLPSGEHTILVSLEDTKGNVTKKELTLRIQ